MNKAQPFMPFEILLPTPERQKEYIERHDWLEAELDRVNKLTNWQPIETAPMDLEIILARFHPNLVDPIIGSGILLEHTESHRGVRWIGWDMDGEPTHWLAMPEAPND